MQFKAICFDLDGTLINSLDDIGNCTNELLLKKGLPTQNLDSIRGFVGGGLKNLIESSLPKKNREEGFIKECQREFEKIYRKNWWKNSIPYDGIPELLDELCKKKLKLTILSNKPQEFTSLVTSRILSKWKFDLVLGQSNDIPKKPDPTGFFLIRDKFQLLSKEFIFLGDTGIDMKTAIAGGCYPIGALWGYRSKKELEDNGAEITIRNPLELVDIIYKLNQ